MQPHTVSKYVEVKTIGYGAELADAEPVTEDAEAAEADPVADADEALAEADEHAVKRVD